MDKMRRMPKVIHPDLFSQHETRGTLPALRQDHEAGTTWMLTEDITGVKGKQYGIKSERVTVVSVHDNVLIVQSCTSGNRFSVSVEKVKAC